MTHTRLPLRARLAELRYWRVTRPLEKLKRSAVHALPVALKRAAFVDVAAHATTRPPLDRREVPGVTITDVMKSWDHPERITA